MRGFKTAVLVCAALATPLFAPTLIPERGSSVAGLVASAGLERAVIAPGTAQEHYLVVTLTGPERGEIEPHPLDLTLVIDRSGSMAGTKIEQAKTAAKELVDQLGPADRLSLVAFDSEPVVVFDGDLSRDEARGRIEALGAHGGTDLLAALRVGMQQPSVDHAGLKRVLFISDGRDQSPLARLRAQAADRATDGVAVAALGLGLDFDEDRLQAIAAGGGGGYHYLDDFSALPGRLTHELRSSGRVTAQRVSVRLDLHHARVRERYGADAGVTVVGDLVAGETRKVVVKVSVNANGRGARTLGQVVIRWRDPRTGLGHHQRLPVRVEVGEQDGPADPVLAPHASRAIGGLALDRANRALAVGERSDCARALASGLEDVLALGAYDGLVRATLVQRRRACGDREVGTARARGAYLLDNLKALSYVE